MRRITGYWKSHRRTVAVLLCLAVAGAIVVPALSAPRTPKFGPGIEDPPDYDGQTKCSPSAKPGVLAFQRKVLREYPMTGSLGISRACDIGGRSEHKEGRAWDWAADVGDASERAAVRDMLHWLLAEDRNGRDYARFRRLGLMYMIWNKRIWTPWSGWRTYCTMSGSACLASDGSARSPHTNHVHFSFTRAGAFKNTTWWHPSRSRVAALVASARGSGYWQIARNGSVLPYNSGYYGGQSHRYLDHPAVAGASSASGNGYWLVSKKGRVWAFGDAPHKGSVVEEDVRISDVAATPSGNGYWLLTKRGRVFAPGNARNFGDKRGSDGRWVGISPTATGAGYRLFASAGKVASYGDARKVGSPAGRGLTVADGASRGRGGYWLLTRKGRVMSFGNAPDLGSARGKSSRFVDIAPTVTGRGYWLATARGRVYARGDAPTLSKQAYERLAPEVRPDPSEYPDISDLRD